MKQEQNMRRAGTEPAVSSKHCADSVNGHMAINMDKLILIVDDARFARNITKRALTAGGYTRFIEAATAAEALEAFRENKPELTLLDITLPDNSDLTLLGSMLSADPGAKIIMVSAIGQDLIIADALSLGAADFITKPFNEPDFLSIIKNVLES